MTLKRVNSPDCQDYWITQSLFNFIPPVLKLLCQCILPMSFLINTVTYYLLLTFNFAYLHIHEHTNVSQLGEVSTFEYAICSLHGLL